MAMLRSCNIIDVKTLKIDVKTLKRGAAKLSAYLDE
jgi:hypothetical protein